MPQLRFNKVGCETKMKLSNAIKVLIRPDCWMQYHSYSEAWDAVLNRMMETEKFKRLNDCKSDIGGVTVWIKNHPYASFTPEDVNARPKRSTILRAMEKFITDTNLIQISRSPKTDDQLWNTVAESSFEVVHMALKKAAGKETISTELILRESQAATCALQELNNREKGFKPESLRE